MADAKIPEFMKQKKNNVKKQEKKRQVENDGLDVPDFITQQQEEQENNESNENEETKTNSFKANIKGLAKIAAIAGVGIAATIGLNSCGDEIAEPPTPDQITETTSENEKSLGYNDELMEKIESAPGKDTTEKIYNVLFGQIKEHIANSIEEDDINNIKIIIDDISENNPNGYVHIYHKGQLIHADDGLKNYIRKILDIKYTSNEQERATKAIQWLNKNYLADKSIIYKGYELKLAKEIENEHDEEER